MPEKNHPYHSLARAAKLEAAVRAAVHAEDTDRQLDVRGHETSVLDTDVEDAAVMCRRRIEKGPVVVRLVVRVRQDRGAVPHAAIAPKSLEKEIIVVEAIAGANSRDSRDRARTGAGVHVVLR